MKDKPRVLIIDFTDFFGGGQKFILNLDLCFENEISFFYAIASMELIKALKPVNTLRIDGRLKRTIKSIREINKFIEQNSIDIAILNGNRPIYFSFAISHTVKKIAYKHTSNNAFNSIIKRVIASFFLNINYIFCDKVVLLYEKSRNEVILNKKSVHIIPNFIVSSHGTFDQQRKKNNQVVRIVTISRLDSNKGIEWLINCFLDVQVLVQQKIELIIAGEGPEKDKLYEICRNRNAENVTFLGFITSVETLLKSSDIFVLPSRFESFPLTILEAMNFGLPIIATNTGGISELIDHNVNGYMVDYNDSQNLKKHLLTLISNEQKRSLMGTASLEKYTGQFSTDQFKMRLHNVLRID